MVPCHKCIKNKLPEERDTHWRVAKLFEKLLKLPTSYQKENHPDADKKKKNECEVVTPSF